MKSMFARKFDEIETTVAFNPAWANGTGYLDHAVDGEHAIVLAPGAEAKCEDEYGRKVIFIGTMAGPIVVFQRFAADDLVVTYNASKQVRALNLIPGSNMSEDTQHMVLYGKFVGKNFNALLEQLKNILCNCHTTE